MHSKYDNNICTPSFLSNDVYDVMIYNIFVQKRRKELTPSIRPTDSCTVVDGWDFSIHFSSNFDFPDMYYT